jgi:hypothetical protein
MIYQAKQVAINVFFFLYTPSCTSLPTWYMKHHLISMKTDITKINSCTSSIHWNRTDGQIMGSLASATQFCHHCSNLTNIKSISFINIRKHFKIIQPSHNLPFHHSTPILQCKFTFHDSQNPADYLEHFITPPTLCRQSSTTQCSIHKKTNCIT